MKVLFPASVCLDAMNLFFRCYYLLRTIWAACYQIQGDREDKQLKKKY